LPRSVHRDDADTGSFSNGLVAYKFHTNILAVNHIIRSEAEELLYKRNIFIVVSYQWSELNSVLGGLRWVPMVSKKLVNRMHRHSARIHIGRSSADLAALARDTGAKVPVKAFILLGDDIKAFCLSVCHSVANAAGPLLQLDSASPPNTKVMVDRQNMDKKPAHLKFELRDTEYRLMDASTQHRLLAPFDSVIGPSQRVIFTGKICDEAETTRLRRIMGPSASCSIARWCSLIDNFSRVKDLADDALKTDDFAFVLHLYRQITAGMFYLMTQVDVRGWVLQHCPQTAIDMCTMCMKLMLNVACGSLKIGDWIVCNDSLHNVTQFATMRDDYRDAALASVEILDDDLVVAYHLNAHIWYFLHRDYDHGEQSIIRTVKDTIEALERYAIGPHQKHDCEVLRRFHDQDAILCKESLPLHQCSAIVLPLPFTSPLKLTDSQRNHFEGWADIDFLHSMHLAAKANVNQVQKTLGLAITDFEQIALSHEAQQRKNAETC
jgi:hypothetical protein